MKPKPKSHRSDPRPESTATSAAHETRCTHIIKKREDLGRLGIRPLLRRHVLPHLFVKLHIFFLHLHLLHFPPKKKGRAFVCTGFIRGSEPAKSEDWVKTWTKKKRTSASRARSKSRSHSRTGIVRARTAARGCKSARQLSTPVLPPPSAVSPRCRRARASVTTWCRISTFFWTSYCSNSLFVLVLSSHHEKGGEKMSRAQGEREHKRDGG